MCFKVVKPCDPNNLQNPGDAGWAFLYFVLTAYLFIGIAIASDIFMNGIEKICGATRTIIETKEEDGVIVTSKKEVLVWNETVANLTLMALGSSAPEILLSVIEISQGLGHHDPGDLGPGTIVGSASFNLMIISALCILCLKDGAISRIKLYTVFLFTCFTSLFAYIWMVVVLQWVTPDQVDLWEALLTLAYFPMLVVISYWADQEFCIRGRPRKVSVVSQENTSERAFYFGDTDEDNLYDAEGNLQKDALQNLYYKLTEIAILTPEEIATVLATKLIQGKQHKRSWYRMKAARALVGGGSGGMPVLDDKLKEVIHVMKDSRRSDVHLHGVSQSLLNPTVLSKEVYLKKAVVDFQAAALAVPENVGTFQVHINRKGKEDVGFQLKVETFDGTAKSGSQYKPFNELVTFDPYVQEMSVEINIIDNAEWNPDSNFYLKMSVPQEFEEKVVAGQMKIIQIIIEDDEKPGKVTFTKLGYLFKNIASQVVYVDVQRVDGADGTISVKYKVIPGPKCTILPTPPPTDGTLTFEAGELKKSITIHLHNLEGSVVGHDQQFEVELYDPEGGAKLGKTTKATCAVSSDETFKLEITNVMSAALQQCEEADEEVSYKDQVKQSLLPNDGDVKNATVVQWVLHIFVFPFKFLLSLIPPPGVAGGWLCFFLALGSIGILTKIVGDSAGGFGSCIGLDPVITAITFVALGTSLPDTFASMIAARNDKTADNAIGNVTGSNSVNVFLGLGLPWTLGSIYYMSVQMYQGVKDPFCVPAGKLTFNVVIFSLLAFVSIAILTARRFSGACGNAELGGPTGTKWVTAVAMIFMWGLYILLSILEIYIPEMSTPFLPARHGPNSTYCSCIVHTARANGIPNHSYCRAAHGYP